MNPNNRAIDEFNKEANASGIKYLIIGGFAASFWGKPRFTADVDYVIELSTLELVKSVMVKLNYELAFLHPKQSFAHFKPISGSNFRMDFMIVDSNTWKRLWSGAKEADFGGIEKFPIVDPIHLIAMKLHSAKQPDREEYFKDLNDIVEIMLAQGYTLEDSEIVDIISRHGTEQTKTLLFELLEKRNIGARNFDKK